MPNSTACAAMADALDMIVEGLKSFADACRQLAETKPDSANEEKTPELKDIQAILATKITEGKKEEVKFLFQQYGAKKLSEVKPEDYKALFHEAEAL